MHANNPTYHWLTINQTPPKTVQKTIFFVFKYFSLSLHRLKNMVIVRNDKRSIFSFIMLLLILFNIGSTSLFVHSHTIEGDIIAHSHPFSGNPESHSHSLASLDIISRMVRGEMLLGEGLTMDVSCLCRTINLSDETYVFYSSVDYTSSQLRAPPVA